MNLEGLLTIDGVDAYVAYKTVVVKGGHDGLLAWPSLKEVETNDWHEYDGLEVDLASPVLASKEFSVDFYIFGSDDDGLANLSGLVAALRNGAYHTLNFAQVGREVKLRVVSFGDPEIYPEGLALSVTFADDFPLDGYVYQSPSSSEPEYDDYLIDDSPFTDYGVRITQGTLKSVINMADVKQNLRRDISTVSGAIYDDPAAEGLTASEALVKLSFRSVKLYCYLTANGLNGFWRNYDALLYDLTKPGTHKLTSRVTGKELGCYYESCEVEDLWIDPGKVALRFIVSLKVVEASDYY